MANFNAGHNIFFIGSAGSLAEAVRETVTSIKGCRFEHLELADARLLRDRTTEVGFLLVYFGASHREHEQAALFLQETGNWDPPVPTIVLSEQYDPELSLKILHLGTEVVECLSLPLDMSRLAFLIDLWLVQQPRRQPALGLSPENNADIITNCVNGFLFDSLPMQHLWEQLQAVATLETTILITGETGTGKTHLARVIHELSPRRAKPFLTVHCGALSSTLLESELFGHVRGAFTSAEGNRAGKLAEVQDGTLLLDEVDCIPLESQSKLLRAVEERVFEPVGSNDPQSLRARLIVATNRPLEAEIAAGRFRADLYYRLNVVSFALPTLREQPELVRLLAGKFLAEFCARANRPFRRLSPAALEALEKFDWPGNVRELRNVIERAVALCPRPVIDLGDLPVPIRQCSKKSAPTTVRNGLQTLNGLDWARKEAELNRLLEALKLNDHNRSSAAAELGISRVTLYKKMRLYGLI